MTEPFRAVRDLITDVIPREPDAPRFRQRRTLGGGLTHRRRAKFFERYRLFFRFDSASEVIAYDFLNDDATLRERGGRSDPYVAFGDMLRAGSPPDDWAALVAACEALTAERAAEPTANAPTHPTDDPTA